MNDVAVFAEIYRPATIDECILPAATKKMVKDSIANGNIPSLIFAGSAGCGKTSLARAIANDVGADLYYINASLDRSIDTIRDKVVSFSSSISFDGNLKIVLLDEAEGLSAEAMKSLKGVYEEFPHVRFIMTTNALAKVIEPILSRSVVVDFKVDKAERPKLAVQFMKKITDVLKAREVTFDMKVIAELVNKYFPDFRRTWNEIQRHAASGHIDSSALLNSAKGSYKDLIVGLAAKDFKQVRIWVGENASDDLQLFKDFYEHAFEYFKPESVPQLILLLDEYQCKAGNQNNDPQINVAAFCVKVMSFCDFKE